MPTQFTPRDIANKWHVSAPSVRKFLRTIKPDEKPNQGGRWAVSGDELTELRLKYDEMHARSQHQAREALARLKQDLDDLEWNLNH